MDRGIERLIKAMEDEEDNYAELDDVNIRSKKEKIYGMEEELEKLIQGIMRYKKHNVLLIGKAGVGKSALVEKLAQNITKNNVPKFLKNKKIMELSLNTTIAGTRFRGEFEEKVKKILDKVSEDKDIILFVDEIHNILNLGGAEGAMRLGETLKPYLARGKITLIGATTKKEYMETIKKDAAFDRRFYKIEIKEPTCKEVLEMLKYNKKEYEKHYKMELLDKDFKIVMQKAKRRKGSFPDKAFDELEEYCYKISKNNI